MKINKLCTYHIIYVPDCHLPLLLYFVTVIVIITMGFMVILLVHKFRNRLNTVRNDSRFHSVTLMFTSCHWGIYQATKRIREHQE